MISTHQQKEIEIKAIEKTLEEKKLILNKVKNGFTNFKPEKYNYKPDKYNLKDPNTHFTSQNTLGYLAKQNWHPTTKIKSEIRRHELRYYIFANFEVLYYKSLLARKNNQQLKLNDLDRYEQIIINMLKTKGADGHFPLEHAASLGHKDFALRLIELHTNVEEASCDFKNDENYTPLLSTARGLIRVIDQTYKDTEYAEYFNTSQYFVKDFMDIIDRLLAMNGQAIYQIDHKNQKPINYFIVDLTRVLNHQRQSKHTTKSKGPTDWDLLISVTKTLIKKFIKQHYTNCNSCESSILTCEGDNLSPNVLISSNKDRFVSFSSQLQILADLENEAKSEWKESREAKQKFNEEQQKQKQKQKVINNIEPELKNESSEKSPAEIIALPVLQSEINVTDAAISVSVAIENAPNEPSSVSIAIENESEKEKPSFKIDEKEAQPKNNLEKENTHQLIKKVMQLKIKRNKDLQNYTLDNLLSNEKSFDLKMQQLAIYINNNQQKFPSKKEIKTFVCTCISIKSKYQGSWCCSLFRKTIPYFELDEKLLEKNLKSVTKKYL